MAPHAPGTNLKKTAHGRMSRESKESPIALTSKDISRRASGVQAKAPRIEPDEMVSGRALLVSISSPAKTSLLDPTYAYLSTYCTACFTPLLAERLNVAIYELYSNALQYGTPATDVRLEIQRTEAGTLLTVSNEAALPDIQKLTARVNRVRKDAAAAFTDEMTRFARGNLHQPMLGIVRVAYESAFEVELRVDGARVSMTALCPK